MSSSPNSKLVQRTIDLNYTNKKRSLSLKWILLNAIFLIIFGYDLLCKCPGYTSVLHYVELGCVGVLAANLVQYAVCLAPKRALKLPLSPEQQKLLGLSNADLDSSFILTEKEDSTVLEHSSEKSDADPERAPLWPPASLTPPTANRSPRDRRTTADYLEHGAEPDMSICRRCAGPRPAPVYQLAALDKGGEPEQRSPQGSARAPPLPLDPRRLTRWNLNLRVWLHLTILEPLRRQLALADDALARLALCEAGALREGRVPAARLRPLAAHAPALAPLVAYLEPFPDQRYAVRRLSELAAGGALSAYRWDGGGADWEPSRPTDAELLLHAFGAYLEAAGAGGVAAVERLEARPPHFGLRVGEHTLPVARGRNNLLHALLLLLWLAARSTPPALGRVPLGPAGLNMLWIVDR